MIEFEKFVKDNGWKYKNDDELKSGYEWNLNCARGVLITEDEFIVEAREHYDTETLKAVYRALSELVKQKKLSAGAVYRYAYYKWCLRNAEAIVAYQTDPEKWAVNNCDTEVSEEAAKIAVNREWGFEASRIRIIGTSYYDATDYQFIRFDCAHMTWLWRNGSLYQVYE